MSDKYPGGFVTANAPAGFSVFFDGTGDYFTAADNANLELGSGDFTIECWINTTVSNGGYVSAVSKWGSSNQSYMIRAASTDIGSGWSFFYSTNGTNYFTVFGSSINDGAWHHVAVTRSGNVFRTFTDGVLKNSTTDAVTLYNGTSAVTIGAGDAGANPFTGYLSNVRIVKGTALYTAAFTPPTQLFPVTNTQLLVCQSPTIIDNSSNAFTLTVAGNTVVSNFTPFAAYTGFNPALGAAAGGVWTLDEAAYYQNNRQWPIYDPYFKNTTLMLHGNGTNGAQNNTFLDSSTNNFTITRNGNTTQGTFTPFSQTGWSTFFASASSQSLTAPNNNAFKFAGQFTIELWVNPIAVSSRIDMVCTPTSASSSTGLYFYIASGKPTFDQGGGNIVTSTADVAANTWTHIALTRNANNLCTIWVNGVASGTATSTINFSDGNLYIGTENAATAYFNGYMSNVRILNGSALYTSNFTPSTQPLTAIPYTVLLTCQNNRFVDNSANNFTITSVNSPSVQAFSPFVPAYITPTTYSNWFDGSGDYLTVPNAAWMNLGTGDFTMECWVQFNSVSSTQMFVSNNYNAGTGGGGWAFLYRQDNTTLKFSCNSNVSYEKTWSPAVGTMYHVAVCRSGTDLRLFVNGVQLGTTSTSSDNISGASSTLDVGTNLGGTPLPINGVISNMRIVTSALYTASFTPPTAPLTAVTNTQLLTCQSSTFIDNSANAATLTANGNVQPVTSPTPFPAKVDTTTLNSAYSTSLIGGSAYFDGSGDYLSASNNTALEFGSGDFTVQCWVYLTSLSNNVTPFSSQSTSGSAMQFGLAVLTSGAISVVMNNAAVLNSSSGDVQLNNWVHIACSRLSGTLRIFKNGVQLTSVANSTTITTGDFKYIGYEIYNTRYLSGYISSLMVQKGTGYTQIPMPIVPLTTTTNTSLLLNYTNGAIFDNTAKNVVETVGNAQISTTQSKWGGSSMYFDGTGDWLNAGKNEMFSIGSAEDFTFEAWIYAASVSDVSVFGIGSSTFFAYRILSGSPYIYVQTTGGLLNAGTITANTWTHIAISRSSGTMRSFLNGIQAASVANTGSFSASAGTGAGVYVGAANLAGASTPGYVFNGYIDDLRFTKGVARYVTNFTPPTSQLQDQ